MKGELRVDVVRSPDISWATCVPAGFCRASGLDYVGVSLYYRPKYMKYPDPWKLKKNTTAHHQSIQIYTLQEKNSMLTRFLKHLETTRWIHNSEVPSRSSVWEYSWESQLLLPSNTKSNVWAPEDTGSKSTCNQKKERESNWNQQRQILLYRFNLDDS